MIGRTEPIKPFELIRWARRQAREHKLRPLEAHVLLLLATYANKDGVAWPSIRSLALDAGLKVKARRRGDRDSVIYENSAVSAALIRLQELGLIWRSQGGRGRPAITELLFNPALEGKDMASGDGEAKERNRDKSEPSLTSDLTEHGLRPDGGEVPVTTRTTRTTKEKNCQMTASALTEAVQDPPNQSLKEKLLSEREQLEKKLAAETSGPWRRGIVQRLTHVKRELDELGVEGAR
jgi:hypothetical protein